MQDVCRSGGIGATRIRDPRDQRKASKARGEGSRDLSLILIRRHRGQSTHGHTQSPTRLDAATRRAGRVRTRAHMKSPPNY